MHFFCGLNNFDSPDESVLYLNLKSSRLNGNNAIDVHQFNMQQVKDYHDNLVITIMPYAS